MNKIIFLLLIVWQFPQFIAGLFMKNFLKVSKVEKYKDAKIFCVDNFNKFGISFGYHIFLSNDDRGRELLLHEYGHSIQSRILGLFYVPVVGAYSIIRQIYYLKKISNIKNSSDKKKLWSQYYQGFPEKWANRLAKVNMDTWKNI